MMLRIASNSEVRVSLHGHWNSAKHLSFLLTPETFESLSRLTLAKNLECSDSSVLKVRHCSMS